MLLAIDVGNTNSKFAVFDGEKLVAQFRLRTESKRTADEYAAWLTQLMELQGFDRGSIKGAILHKQSRALGFFRGIVGTGGLELAATVPE